ncbi:uncharacterized protein GIQ15_02756 [Arthroderma uncinatum]|uniref:uncharacterized protein n=1 Tax=Arthroderma uncinatum TaxID=74035 RepID=UPI00144AB743|nr:uncharacterized protein GIQ15_02756 [Arthroderma uncinatum]KAF3483432.1 hypothetical protein GIQ15_02756 [Arthroderma uncinatum]
MDNNSFVDLTASSPVSAPAGGARPMSPIYGAWGSRLRSRSPPSLSQHNREETKRRRLDNSNATASSSSRAQQRATNGIPGEIESVDLTGVNDSCSLAKFLAKQREDAVLAQKKVTNDKEARSALTGYKCPVCMDVPENATTTICGMYMDLYPIVHTLKYNEARRALEGNSGIWFLYSSN